MCYIFDIIIFKSIYTISNINTFFSEKFYYDSDKQVIILYSNDQHLIIIKFTQNIILRYNLKDNHITLKAVRYQEYIIDEDKNTIIVGINEDVLIFSYSDLKFQQHLVHGPNILHIYLQTISNQLFIYCESAIKIFDYDYIQFYDSKDQEFYRQKYNKSILLQKKYLVLSIFIQPRVIVY